MAYLNITTEKEITIDVIEEDGTVYVVAGVDGEEYDILEITADGDVSLNECAIEDAGLSIG